MKYRKTFREALNDVDKKDKPEAKPEVPVEDKDAIIQQLQQQIADMELQMAVAAPPAIPHPLTGEVPLRTGIASALLDKNGPKPNVEKETKTKVKLSSGKSKIEVNPDVDIGIFSGGNKTNTGNLH